MKNTLAKLNCGKHYGKGGKCSKCSSGITQYDIATERNSCLVAALPSGRVDSVKDYRPIVTQIPIATALKWRGDSQWRFEEKIDGEFATLFSRQKGSTALLAGELLKSRGEFYAFDLLEKDGEDIRPVPLKDRLARLDQILLDRPVGLYSAPIILGISGVKILRPCHGTGGEFLEHIIAQGGEGIVAKPLSSPYAVGWLKAKRSENYIVRVLRKISGTQSVEFEETSDSLYKRRSITATPAAIYLAHGRCPVRAGKIEQLRPGSILKLTGYGQTPSGKIREPRLCTDFSTSWLIKY